jgi:hypothetical protein
VSETFIIAVVGTLSALFGSLIGAFAPIVKDHYFEKRNRNEKNREFYLSKCEQISVSLRKFGAQSINTNLAEHNISDIVDSGSFYADIGIYFPELQPEVIKFQQDLRGDAKLIIDSITAIIEKNDIDKESQLASCKMALGALIQGRASCLERKVFQTARRFVPKVKE